MAQISTSLLLATQIALFACTKQQVSAKVTPASIEAIAMKEGEIAFSLQEQGGCTLGRGDLIKSAAARGERLFLSLEVISPKPRRLAQQPLNKGHILEAKLALAKLPEDAAIISLFVCSKKKRSQLCQTQAIRDLGKIAVRQAKNSAERRSPKVYYAQTYRQHDGKFEMFRAGFDAPDLGYSHMFGEIKDNGHRRWVKDFVTKLHSEISFPATFYKNNEQDRPEFVVRVPSLDNRRCPAIAKGHRSESKPVAVRDKSQSVGLITPPRR